jgi:hypothetical protein
MQGGSRESRRKGGGETTETIRILKEKRECVKKVRRRKNFRRSKKQQS